MKANLPEKVLVDLSTARFENSSTPIIENHNTNLRLGHTTSQTVDGTGIKASGVISCDNDNSRKFVTDAKNKYPFRVSFGSKFDGEFIPPKKEVTLNGKTWKGPLIVARNALIHEISIVTIGADNKTSVSLEAKFPHTSTNKVHNMSLEEDNKLLAENRQRVNKIDALFAEYKDAEKISYQGKDYSKEEFHIEAIGKGMDYSAVKLALLEASFKPCPPSFIPDNSNPLGYRKSYFNKGENPMITCGLMVREGYGQQAIKHFGERMVNDCDKFRSCSLVDFARISLQATYGHAPHSTDEIVQASLQASYHSTSVLTDSVNSALQKILGVLFNESPPDFDAFCKSVNLDNFKSTDVVSPDFTDELMEVGATGQLKMGTLFDKKVSIQVKTYGQLIGLNRKDIINDNLSILGEIPQTFRNKTYRLQADEVYRTLLNAGSHFHTDNGNLITDVLGVDGLSLAILKLRSQRYGQHEMDLNLAPRTLLVGPSNEMTARAIVADNNLHRDGADNLPEANPLAKAVDPIIQSRLENSTRFPGVASTTAWWLFAGKEHAPLYIATLGGSRMPKIEQVAPPPDQLGVVWRCYTDFGVCLGHPQSAVKSTGAGS